MSTTWSPEMSFIPSRYPHEVTNRRSGARLVYSVNRWLARHGNRTGVRMWSKLDPHHNVHCLNETYTVEVCPITSFDLSWVNRDSKSHAGFVKAIDRVFTVLRDRFGLVPYVVTRKGDTDLHYPSGGMHIQYGADLFGFSTDWYRRMERFHRNLLTDYANRPYARWLLAHWMGEGSHVMVDRHRLEQRTFNGGAFGPLDLFSRALFGASAIEPRFMESAKSSYLTFEFRIVGMVENARQMCAAVRLIQAWVVQHQCHAYDKHPTRFSLTVARWDEMTTPAGALKHCRAWVKGLGLDWADYEDDFFKRNLLMRIAHGKLE